MDEHENSEVRNGDSARNTAIKNGDIAIAVDHSCDVEYHPKHPKNDSGLMQSTAEDIVAAESTEESKEEDNGETKKKKKRGKDKEKTPSVSLRALYRFADSLDKVLMTVGIIMAALHGVLLPVHFILFGTVADGFINFARVPDVYNMTSTNNTLSEEPEDLSAYMSTFAIYYCILAIVNFIFAYGMMAPWMCSAERQVHKMRITMFRSIMRQDIGWFDTHDSGAINNRLNEDLQKVHDGIGEKNAMLLQCITVFFGGFLIAFIYGPKLTAVILAIVPLIMIFGGVFSKILANLTSGELDAYASAGSIAEEVISSIKTVAAFGGENKEYERYTEKLTEAKKSGIKKGLNTGLSIGMFQIVIYCGYALAFWYGAKLIIDGEMSGGSLLIVFFSVLTGAFQLGMAGPSIQAVATAKGAAYKAFEIIDRVPTIDSESLEGRCPEGIKGEITFKDVEFSYPSREDVKVLCGINLHISSGQTIALVGESGCGKSTTTKLLLRFYDPQSGMVQLDGTDIKDLNLKWLRKNIGVVSQEPVLFDTTIEENIRYGQEGVTTEQIVAAAKAANAHKFIVNFPQGYGTLVGERGAQMSGGQKQRIAIARALVRDPKILLLDEATSALDTESEGIVQAALDKARQGRTTIIIAHRLSTVRTADTIAAFQDGVIVEQGTHKELMEIEDGVYSQLVKMQTFTDDVGEDEEVGDLPQEHAEKASGRVLLRACSTVSNASSQGEVRMRRLGSGRKLDRTISEQSAGSKKNAGIQEEEEDENIEPASFFKILRLNLSEWPWLCMGSVGAMFNAIYPVAFSFIFGEILSTFALKDEDEMRSRATFWALMFIVLGGGSFIGQFLQNYCFATSGEILTMRLRSSAFRSILRQDMAFFDDPKHSTGALTTNLATHASSVKMAAGQRLGVVVMTIILALSTTTMALISSWKLTLAMIAFVPFLVLTGVMNIRHFIRGSNKKLKGLEECGKVAVESVDNIQTVAALGREQTFYKKYERLLMPALKKCLRDAQFYSLCFGLSETIMYFLNALAFYYGGVLVENGEINFDGVMKVVIVVLVGARSAGQVSAGTAEFVKAKVAGAHLFNLFAQVPSIDHETLEGVKIDNCRGSIEIRQVQFHYPTRPDQAVLKDVSFTVSPGQTLALVGASGCGKSTILSLLERFYDANNGALLIDGQDIRSCNVQWLRSQFGIVSQEPVLFDCSIRDNIAYGDNTRTFSEDEIESAAKAANIHSFIISLPEGYNTMVGDKGTLISGGQKQRIAIARALIRKPKILLLDEATSALDTESEKVVQEALDEARRGRTCIVIAHRLSTVQTADMIAVVHSGQVVETGTHQELLAMKGKYYALNVGQTDLK